MLILVVSELSGTTVHSGSSVFDLLVCFSGLCSRILPVPKYPESTEPTMGLESQDLSVCFCKCMSGGI